MPKGTGRAMFALLLMAASLLAAVLACGGNEGALGTDMTAQPENMQISGLPLYICPTSTPVPTHTQFPTQIQPTVSYPPSGWVTNTPLPGGVTISRWLCPPLVPSCGWYPAFATNTPFPGGLYSTPPHAVPGATSTPRPTHTPWPSPTPFTSSYYYFFDDDVYTEHADTALDLRLRIGNIRTFPSTQPGRQVAAYEIQVENRGPVFFVFLPAVQTFVSGVGGESGAWFGSSQAADEAGIVLQPEATDGVQVYQGQTVVFDMAAYTPVGAVEAIAWILDPYAGFDGLSLAGGNLAYWINGDHQDCKGNVDGGAVVPTPSTPHPTPTLTPTFSGCVGLACATMLP